MYIPNVIRNEPIDATVISFVKFLTFYKNEIANAHQVIKFLGRHILCILTARETVSRKESLRCLDPMAQCAAGLTGFRQVRSLADFRYHH